MYLFIHSYLLFNNFTPQPAIFLYSLSLRLSFTELDSVLCWPSYGAALSVTPRLSVCLSVFGTVSVPSVLPVPQITIEIIISQLESRRNF